VATDFERLAGAIEATDKSQMTIIDNVSTMSQIAAWCHRLKQKTGDAFKLVVIDYLQLMFGDGKSENREKEVATLSRGLKRLAKELKVVVVALSQLSRAPEGRKDKRPILSDLRESGALEQDADSVIILFREEMHGETDENRGIAEVIIAKQRDGPTGVLRLYFAKEFAWFRDLAIA
jgi:replicative DNA helicase